MHCNCGKRHGSSSLEIVALVVIGVVVVAVVLAPHLSSAAAGGALTAVGAKLLIGAFGNGSSPGS
jgi:hypothetical protein